MIQKKICMLGSFSVGKTSLVRRLVSSLFDEKYLTTVGVKVDKKVINCDGTELTLLLWDLAGEDDFSELKQSYLRGASGYLLVVDGTRESTLTTAMNINKRIKDTFGDLPCILVFNKKDLHESWQISTETIQQFRDEDWDIIETSALTGDAVDQTFVTLARKMLASR